MMNETISAENEAKVEAANDDLSTKIYVLLIIIVLTIVGNGIILYLVLSRWRNGSSMTRVHYFMLHLSFADVITAFLTLLPELIWTLTAPFFYGGNFVCKAVKFMQMIGPYLR